MNLPNLRRAACLAACACSPALFAQPSNQPSVYLDPIIVTATRSAEPLQATIGDNSVVTRAELDARPDATVSEVLGRQRGITFVNYGGPQTLSTINVRGTNSNQTLVLIDGVRINNGSNGLPPLNAVPANAIERIEIVRGATSSLYGADAIGGVINIITRQGAERPATGYVNIGVGSYATTEYDAGVSGASNNWTYSFFGGYGQSNGFNATNPDNFFFNPDRDSYYRSNVGGSLSYEWAPDQRLSLQTLQSRLNAGIDNGAPFFNDRGIQELSSNSISSRNRINDRWTSILTAGLMIDNYESVNRPSPGNDGRQTFRTQQGQYTWQNNFALTQDHALVIGVERLEQKVNGSFSDGGFPQDTLVGYDGQRLFTNSVFAGFDGSWGIHTVQASLRNDYNSQYKNFLSASLNYAIDLTDRWRASVGVSNGFRAPNFNELYWPQTSSFVGNPNLAPEKSKNVEAGLRYLTGRGEVALAAYWNQISNAIVNEPVTPGTFVFTPVNIGQAKIRGVTLSGNYAVTNELVVGGSFDWLSAVNADTKQLLALRAQRVLKLDATYQLQRFTFDAQWLLTSARKEVFSDSFLGGYGLVNLGVAYDWRENATLRFQWNNVFDKSYNLVEGYNTPGSNFFVNLTLRY
jgi:vitamin B12 transporter